MSDGVDFQNEWHAPKNEHKPSKIAHWLIERSFANTEWQANILIFIMTIIALAGSLYFFSIAWKK